MLALKYCFTPPITGSRQDAAVPELPAGYFDRRLDVHPWADESPHLSVNAMPNLIHEAAQFADQMHQIIESTKPNADRAASRMGFNETASG